MSLKITLTLTGPTAAATSNFHNFLSFVSDAHNYFICILQKHCFPAIFQKNSGCHLGQAGSWQAEAISKKTYMGTIIHNILVTETIYKQSHVS